MTLFHNPPTAPLVYAAEAIDRAAGPAIDMHRIARQLEDSGLAVYRPATGWRGGQHSPAVVEQINRTALYAADVVLADLRGSIYTIGVPAEIEAATSRGIPVVVIWDDSHPRSVVLQANPLVSWSADNADAVASTLDLALYHYKEWGGGNQIRPEPIRFTMALGAQPPRMAFPDDAGFDLVTAVETEIPPHTFCDIPTTITGVQCPQGTWLLITGRSSTIRRRSLLVPNGIIDHGWRGPLMAGVYNLTDQPVWVGAGERVAQAILQVSVTQWHPIQVVDQLEPHDRGLLGFGSTGTSHAPVVGGGSDGDA